MKKIKEFFKLIINKAAMHKKVAAIIAAIVVLITALLVIWLCTRDVKYFYVDINGNKGVADKCWSDDCGLYCSKEIGGAIQVHQYTRGK